MCPDAPCKRGPMTDDDLPDDFHWTADEMASIDADDFTMSQPQSNVWVQAPAPQQMQHESEEPLAKRARLESRSSASRKPNEWRCALLTSAVITKPVTRALPPSRAEQQTARALLTSTRLARSHVRPAPLSLPPSWSSGQSFTVRVDRGGLSVAVKCFFTQSSFQCERHTMLLLSTMFSRCQLQTYVRKWKSSFTLGAGETQLILAAAVARIPNRAALLNVSQCSLIFAFYSATLADVIATPRRFDQACTPNSTSSAGQLLTRMVLHCFAGLQLHHQAGILLCDIKPANMFVSHDRLLQPVFGDYGLARVFTPSQSLIIKLEPADRLGTPNYRAPEAERAAEHHYYTAASDVYSLACTLIDVLCRKALKTAERFCYFEDMQHHAAPQPLMQLLLSMLYPQPAARTSLSDAIIICEQLVQFTAVAANGL